MAASAGLIVKEDDSCPPARLPPKSVHAEVQLIERVAQHRLVQIFVNTGSSQLQASYVFPLIDGAAVFGFQAHFSSGRKISCEVRERAEAKQLFHRATDQGFHAAMLEEESTDVFRTSIGSLQPGEEVKVELQWCLELPLTDRSMRLTIPSHVAPRYSPAEQLSTGESEIRWYSSTAPEAEFTATVSAEMGAGGKAKIESPTHPSIAVHHSQDNTMTTAELKTKGLDTDLVFIVTPADIFQPVVVREVLEEHGTEALMLNLVPEFSGMKTQSIEVVFVLDCSGSMGGRRIEQAKRATQIFLRSLPADCRFNIVLFGSSFKSLYAEGSASYSEASLREAESYVDSASANMGGTEIVAPLRFVRDSKPFQLQRQIILLTDGEVSNQREVFDLVRDMGCRVFSVGIGSGVSTALVNGVALATNGSAAFVQDNEKLEPVCISMLKKAASPSVSNINISWPDSSSFRSQTKPPPIFPGEGFSGFALYPCGTLQDHATVKLTGTTPNGNVEFEVPVSTTAKVISDGQVAILHKMFARSVIRDVEEKEHLAQSGMPSYKTEATQLSIQHSVLCSYTAFVGVEHSGDGSIERAVDVCKLAQPSILDTVQYLKSVSHTLNSQLVMQCAVLESCDTLECLSVKSASLSASSCQFNRCSSRPTIFSKLKAVLRRISDVFLYVSAFTRDITTSAKGRSVVDLERQNASTAIEVSSSSNTLRPSSSNTLRPSSSNTLSNPTLINQTLQTKSFSENKGSKAKQLENLLRLARFDGSFTHSLELEALTGIDQKAIASWTEAQWGKSIDADILVTAKVLVCLRVEFETERTTWELVANKATDWLRTKELDWCSASIASIDTLLNVAASQMAISV